MRTEAKRKKKREKCETKSRNRYTKENQNVSWLRPEERLNTGNSTKLCCR
jgi:hypothetical protein